MIAPRGGNQLVERKAPQKGKQLFERKESASKKINKMLEPYSILVPRNVNSLMLSGPSS